MIEEKLLNKVDEKIKMILEEDIDASNLEHLYKLSKIRHMTKEDEEMNYGNYGNYSNYGRGGNYGRGNYGRDEYGEYGARSRDSRGRYRGHDHLDRMYEDYGRYMEGRERYGANEDTMRSLQYMLKSMEDFARMLKEEASSQEEVQMIRETAQRIAQM